MKAINVIRVVDPGSDCMHCLNAGAGTLQKGFSDPKEPTGLYSLKSLLQLGSNIRRVKFLVLLQISSLQYFDKMSQHHISGHNRNNMDYI